MRWCWAGAGRRGVWSRVAAREHAGRGEALREDGGHVSVCLGTTMTDAAEVVRLCFCPEPFLPFQRDEPVNGGAGTRDAGPDGPRQWLALSLCG